MEQHTITTTIYKFNELAKDVQDKVVQNLYDINVDYEDWHEFVLEDAKQVGKILGIDISNIFYRGFSSQGDGACFEGTYEHAKGSVKAIKEYAPKDEELHSIAEEMQRLQKPYFYQIRADVEHSGHYYHDMCTAFSFYRDGYEIYDEKFDEEPFKEVIRDFMKWIYKALQSEYDYKTSREAIVETIEANEYDFTVDGKLYNKG